MFKLATCFAVTWKLMTLINGDVKTILDDPDSINIQAKAVNNDLIWTDEKDMVGVYLPDKAKKNGKATGFRDIILENAIQLGFKRVMEKIRNPELFNSRWGIHDPMTLNEQIDMNKKEDLYT